MLRVAIVNDMKMTVEMLRRIIQSVSGYQIAWIAYDGAEAVEKCKKDPPDLILMDLIMPVMDGVETTKTIMSCSPCAILIVTATVSGNASKVFEAMGYGALDVVKTPVLDPQTLAVDSKELLLKIKRIATLIGKTVKAPPTKQKKKEPAVLKREVAPLLLMGASTGGPMALVRVLSQLPKPSPFATIVVQHVDEQFSEGLAVWLTQQTGAPVKVVEAGMLPQAGVALLAGKNDHLVMTSGGKLHYSEDPIDNPYRPSVDVFYNSVAQNWSQKGVAVLLTGMGSDGAKGLKALLELGWHTIAQDEQSCIVFGMPKAAIAIGGAKEILPLMQIGSAIVAAVKT